MRPSSRSASCLPLRNGFLWNLPLPTSPHRVASLDDPDQLRDPVFDGRGVHPFQEQVRNPEREAIHQNHPTLAAELAAIGIFWQ